MYNYKRKNVIMIVMLIAVVFMATGYALFSSVLNIRGVAVTDTIWQIEIIDIKSKSTGTAYDIDNPSYTATTARFNAGLKKPGDKMEYTITVKNNGNVSAIIDEVKATEAGNSLILYSISGLQNDVRLESGATATFTLSIEFDRNATYIPNDANKEVNMEIICIQDNGQELNSSEVIVVDKSIATVILNDNEEQSDENIVFSKTSLEDGTNGLYYTSSRTENDKTTYYFRGNVNNNYVSFAGILWRIVRINEDGSVRLVTNTRVGTSKFNESNLDNAYAGYMFGLTGVTGDANLCLSYDEETNAAVVSDYTEENCVTNGGTWVTTGYDATHANIVNSTMKTTVDNWYKTNLLNYTSYLVDAGFCNDRSVAPEPKLWSATDTALGYGEKRTTYGGGYRHNTLFIPQFVCPNPDHDLFTTSTSDKGNKKLDYPVGLMTVDEVMYAGVSNSSENKSLYIYDVDAGFATMSNASYSGGTWHAIYYLGKFARSNSGNTFGVRPVINIKGELAVVKGNGLKETPYLIKTN